MLHVIKARRGSLSLSVQLYIREHWTSPGEATTGIFFVRLTQLYLNWSSNSLYIFFLFEYCNTEIKPVFYDIFCSRALTLARLNKDSYTYVCQSMCIWICTCMYVCTLVWEWQQWYPFREPVLSKEASISGVFCVGWSSQGQQLKELSLCVCVCVCVCVCACVCVCVCVHCLRLVTQ